MAGNDLASSDSSRGRIGYQLVLVYHDILLFVALYYLFNSRNSNKLVLIKMNHQCESNVVTVEWNGKTRWHLRENRTERCLNCRNEVINLNLKILKASFYSIPFKNKD